MPRILAVKQAYSIDGFKKSTPIDKFWSCEDVMFDWTADLAGSETDQSVLC